MKKTLCIVMLAGVLVAWKAVAPPAGGNRWIPDVVTPSTRLQLLSHDATETHRADGWLRVISVEGNWVHVEEWVGSAPEREPRKRGSSYWLNLADVRGFRVLP